LSKAGDITGVLAANEALLKDAKNTVNGIKTWLEEHDSRNPKPLLPEPDKQLLIRLRKYCETYNMNGIDEIMDELESADYSTDASLIIWLREKINESDFSSVVFRLSAYEEESV